MELTTTDGIATLQINTGKANAIDLSFLENLARMVDQFASGDARGLIITGHERHFCAGLMLTELIDLDREAISAFITTFNDVMLKLFSVRKPVVAAINGHAIAGGCVLALQADVRIAFGGDLKIGLNETQLAIGLPTLVVETLRAQVPTRSLRPIALEGRLFSAKEALGLGLVDEVVGAGNYRDEPRATFEAAVARRVSELSEVPAAGFGQVKFALRAPVIEYLNRHNNVDAWVDTWFSDEARRRRDAVVARLQK